MLIQRQFVEGLKVEFKRLIKKNDIATSISHIVILNMGPEHTTNLISCHCACGSHQGLGVFKLQSDAGHILRAE